MIFLVSTNTFASSTSDEQREENNNEVNLNRQIEMIGGENIRLIATNLFHYFS